MRASLKSLVARRAGNRCEYCRLPQSGLDITFHVEHLVARQHGGRTLSANLALACPFCNAAKGPNLTTLDPLRGELVRLFDPRHERWDEHFRLEGSEIIGLTPSGRGTVLLLAMNSERTKRLRAAILAAGGW